MPTKEQILTLIKKYPHLNISTYSKILGFSINEHTTENQFYILHRRNEIKRDNKNKFFKRDTFYLTRSGEKKINYLNKKY